MKKKSITIQTDENPLQDLIDNLEIWQEEWKKSPEYLERVDQRQRMELFKKSYPLYEIVEPSCPCRQCVVISTCNKSFFDGSACKKYKKSLKKFLKEKGWYKNGGRERKN